jgi:two-component system CheB/CheR fusion protein
VALLNLAVAIIAISGIVRGVGPFAHDSPHESMLLVVVFLGATSLTAMLLAASIRDRERVEELRARELAIAEAQREHLRLALTGGKMGVWDWEIASGRMRWSATLEAMFGLAPGRFAGTYRGFQELIYPADLAHVCTALAAALAGLQPDYDDVFRVKKRDSNAVWIRAMGTVVRDAHSRPVRMIGVGIDISNQKQLEQELRERAAELAAQDRRKDEFLAMLAHELRNPLAPIRTSVELLRRAPHDSDVLGQVRAVVERQVHHLSRLVDDLLDVSRITRGKISLKRQTVELVEMVQNVADANRHVVGARDQQITVDAPADTIQVDADPVRLDQVLVNLIHNASKYTQDGGHISVSIFREPQAVCVSVRDDGIGMSVELLSRAFDLFVQGERGLDRSQSGLGIGLTIARRLVELHGGTLTARSGGPGLGSEFTVRLPMHNVVVAPLMTATAPPSSTPRPFRILVVEDNRDAADSLRMVLRAEGHQVEIARSGRSAISIAGAFVPEVVLLDIGLPEMCGYEVARAIRANPSLRSAKIIAVTGYGQISDRVSSIQAGCDAHLVKPLDMAALTALLAR